MNSFLERTAAVAARLRRHREQRHGGARLPVYLDDIELDGHNPWCGQLLPVDEFNGRHGMRKISPFQMLRAKRIFKNARFIDQIYSCHVFDHARRHAARVLLPFCRIFACEGLARISH